MNILTIKEFVPGYQGLESYYITYNLSEMTVTIENRTKPMKEHQYKKALEYLNKNKLR